MTRYALILSPIIDDNPQRSDAAPTYETITTAINNSWNEVYDSDDGTPVAVYEGGASALLDAEEVAALLDALEVGLDGIDDDTVHGNVAVALAQLRAALA